MFNIGDKVAALDEDISGVVVSIKNNEVEVETTDGFLMTYFVNELIKVNITSELSSFISTDKLYKAIQEKTGTKITKEDWDKFKEFITKANESQKFKR